MNRVNKLNDLSGKEWLLFQKSWFTFHEKPRDVYAKQHPAGFSPEIARYFIEFFTKPGMVVLDPFVGSGATCLGALVSGRNSIGVDISPEYFKLSAERLVHYGAIVNLNDGDMIELEKDGNLVQLWNRDSEKPLPIENGIIDYVFTSPPYWNMLDRKTEHFENRLEGSKSYTSESLLLINLPYNDFVISLAKILYVNGIKKLKSGSYMTVILKNCLIEGKLYPLAWDVASELSGYENVVLKDERIWCQENIPLFPFAMYSKTWKSNSFHHYCLQFQRIK